MPKFRSETLVASLSACHYVISIQCNRLDLFQCLDSSLLQRSSAFAKCNTIRQFGDTSWQSTALPLTELADTSLQDQMIASSR